MKRTNNDNINFKSYWNKIYTEKKDQEHLEKTSSFTDEWVIDPRNGAAIRPSKRFKTAIDQIKEHERVLDIGCGFGIFTGGVIEKFPMNEVWGVDISDAVIEDNKIKHPDVIYHQQYVGNLNKVPTDYFDVVFSGEVLEHLDDPIQLFKDASACLKKGGRFIVTTPLNRSVDSPEHVWYFDKDDITEMFRATGFELPQFIDLPDVEKHIVIFAIGEKL